MPNVLSANVPSNLFSIDIDSSSATGLAQYNAVVDALNAFYAQGFFNLIYASNQFNLPTKAGDDGKIHIQIDATESDNAFYTDLTKPDLQFNTILLGADIFEGLIEQTVNNTVYTAALAETLLHELSHALLTPIVRGSAYVEEPNIFLTNFVTHEIGATNERMGHAGSVITLASAGISASAIEYLAGMRLIDHHTTLDAAGGYGDYVFEFQNASLTITKTYFAPNTNGTDHLITIEATGSGVLDGSGGFADIRYSTIAQDSIVEGASAKLAYLESVKIDLAGFIAEITSITTPDMQLNITSGLSAGFLLANPTDLLTISAERFVDTVDVQGPVTAAGTTTADAPSALTLGTVGHTSTAGTMIFGGGGFNVSTISGVGAFHLDHTVDHLAGDEGNDILFAGDGISTTGDRNILDGGAGNNFLFGDLSATAAPSTLLGSAGNNIFISGSGADYLIGGSTGLAMVDYGHSSSAVTIDLRTTSSLTYLDANGISLTVDATSGSGGDATGDKYVGMKVFMGTSGDDVFYGASGANMYSYVTDGHVFIGGDGDDTFHLGAGDVAIGGGGSNTYYIDTLTDTINLNTLIGVNADDKIYVDGALYTGRTRVMASDHYESFGEPHEHGYVVSDTSAYGVMYGTPSGFNGTLQPGDAVRYDALGLDRIDDGNGDLNGAASLAFYDSIAGHLAAVEMIGYQPGDAGINQLIDSAVLNFLSPFSNTIEIVTTDGNTPNPSTEVYDASGPSITDYSYFVPELQFS